MSISWGQDYLSLLNNSVFHHEKPASINSDALVKSRKSTTDVIPAKAGIQKYQMVTKTLDPGFRRGDDFLRSRQ